MNREFVLLDAFQRSFRWWWLIAAAGILGGLLGLGFSRLNPPQYEAMAVFEGTIDFTQIDVSKLEKKEFTAGDQDLALHVIETMLIRVRQPVVDALNAQGIPMDYWTLVRGSSIERRVSRWELRFRHRDPAMAQAVIDTWSRMGLEAMRQAQASGEMAPYIILDPVEVTPTPDAPRYYQANQLIMAGLVLGLIAGAALALGLGSRKGRAG